MKRRKAETLAESIMSLAAFGVIMAGVCDFMSNQINFIAWTKHRDELMYNQEWLLSNGQWILANNISTRLDNHTVIAGNKVTYPKVNEMWFDVFDSEEKKLISVDVEYVEEHIVSFDWDNFDWDNRGKMLIVKNNIAFLSFDLSPDIE